MATSAVVAFIVASTMYWLPWVRANFDILGEKPLLDYALGFATLGVAALAALFTGRTLRLNAQSAASGRFQKGIELLASGSQATAIGGIAIHTDVARHQPRQFLWPMIMTLRSFLQEAGPDSKAPLVSFYAINAFASVPRKDRWPSPPYKSDESLSVNAPNVVDRTYNDGDFYRIALLDATLHLEFLECVFDETTIELNARSGGLIFDRCKLDRTWITTKSKKTRIIMIGCDIGQEVRLNGELIDRNTPDVQI